MSKTVDSDEWDDHDQPERDIRKDRVECCLTSLLKPSSHVLIVVWP